MARRIRFYAAGSDLLSVLNEIEAKEHGKYTLFGWANGPEPEF